MAKFFAPNIDRCGRVLRAVFGLCCIGGGVLLWLFVNRWAGAGGVAWGVFCLFEAARGWCVARACGIKTRY